MKKTLLRSKLHRINVTQVELDYEGSCAVDVEILAKGNMQEYEKIDIYNVTNGERFSTYLMAAEAGSKTVSINGAAAHKASPNVLIIIGSSNNAPTSRAYISQGSNAYTDNSLPIWVGWFDSDRDELAGTEIR